MAFSHDFDPGRGFVALPCDVMDIEMSPGAFRLLVELCRMANRSGECWPSLGQLSDRIGRSKAAISGYIAELRDLELVETLNQRMANGYNYRLKYCVTFWQSWRRGLSAQKSKRSVQPVERRESSKNHIKENQTAASSSSLESVSPKLVSVFSNWSELSKNAPFPSFNAPVPHDLVHNTRLVLDDYSIEEPTKDALRTQLQSCWMKLGVICSPSELQLQAKFLKDSGVTVNGFKAFLKEVNEIWESHWRKPPNTQQMEVLLKASQKRNKAEGMLRVLAQYLKRWGISQNKLHARGASPNLAAKQAA